MPRVGPGWPRWRAGALAEALALAINVTNSEPLLPPWPATSHAHLKPTEATTRNKPARTREQRKAETTRYKAENPKKVKDAKVAQRGRKKANQALARHTFAQVP